MGCFQSVHRLTVDKADEYAYKKEVKKTERKGNDSGFQPHQNSMKFSELHADTDAGASSHGKAASNGNAAVPLPEQPVRLPVRTGNPYGSIGSQSAASAPNDSSGSRYNAAGPTAQRTNPYGSVGSGSLAQPPFVKYTNSAVSAEPLSPTEERGDAAVSLAPRLPVDRAFQFSNLRDEVAFKLPGDIHGQGFTISECENCDIYLLDHCGQVQIDDCKNCCIVVGPTDGSVFVRDCDDCELAVSCRQFRTRNAKRCNVMLHCRTKPIIESSQFIGFCCWNVAYAGFKSHLAASKMSMFQNFWSDIHDFTPSPCSWHFVEESEHGLVAFRRQAPPELRALLLEGESPNHADEALSGVLVTAGARPQPQQMTSSVIEITFLCVLMPAAALVAAGGLGDDDDAVGRLKPIAGLSTLLRTNKVRLTSAQADEVCKSTTWGTDDWSLLSEQTCYIFELGSGNLSSAERKARRLGFLTTVNTATACYEPWEVCKPSGLSSTLLA